jgi:hypothetical protein
MLLSDRRVKSILVPVTMSTLEIPASATRNRFKTNSSTPKSSGFTNGMPRSANGAHGQSSSLERLQADIRSPRSRSGADYPRDENEDEVEMRLLGNEQRDTLAETDEDKGHSAKPMSTKDKRAMTLLIILCEPLVESWSLVLMDVSSVDLIQGVPVR